MKLMEAVEMFKKEDYVKRFDFFCEDLNHALVSMYWLDDGVSAVLRIDIRDLEAQYED